MLNAHVEDWLPIKTSPQLYIYFFKKMLINVRPPLKNKEIEIENLKPGGETSPSHTDMLCLSAEHFKHANTTCVSSSGTSVKCLASNWRRRRLAVRALKGQGL